MSAASLQAPQQLILEVPQKGRAPLRVLLSNSVTKIGRDAENEVCIVDDSKVSRFHCEIAANGAQKIIRKLSLKNYLLLNGVEITEAILKFGDVITVGETEIRVTGNIAVPVSLDQVRIAMESSQPKASSLHSPPQGSAPTHSSAPNSAIAPRLHVVPGPSEKPHPPVQKPNANKPSLRSAQASAPTLAKFPGQAARRVSRPQAPARTSQPAPLRIIVAIVALLFGAAYAYIQSQKKAPSLPTPVLRSTEEVLKETEEIRINLEALQEMQKKKEKNTDQYDISQHHYLKGMRDFRQGFYQRAISSFQAAISFYPQHVLAIRYVQLARRKLDSSIQFQMAEGRRSRDRGQLKGCVAAFKKAQVLISDAKDSRFQEAQKYINDCAFRLDGKY